MKAISKDHAAPIDATLLEACLGDFPDGAHTLPTAAFTSEEVFAWEMEHFFAASWVCLGRADSPERGTQIAARAGPESVLLTHDPEGVLRAFFNVCRHRGHELIPETGSPIEAEIVRCPYHRWTYGLDGSFKGGPSLASQAGFDRTDPSHGLVPVRVHEWSGWVFANVSGDAPGFAGHVGALDALIADYEPQRLIAEPVYEYDVQANWKVIAENYHECYHCTEIHPELCRVTTPGSGHDWDEPGTVIGGSMTLNDGVATMSLTGESLGVPFRKLPAERMGEVHYLQVWPALFLSLHPDYVMTHLLEPVSAGRTKVICSWLFPPEARERTDFEASYAADFWDLTNKQDWAACEAVQRGAGSRAYRQGPLTQRERVVHQSIVQVARGYLEGGPPAP